MAPEREREQEGRRRGSETREETKGARPLRAHVRVVLRAGALGVRCLLGGSNRPGEREREREGVGGGTG